MNSEPSSVEIIPLEQLFANAIAYRHRRIQESNEAILDELISDIPHVKDFFQSLGEIGVQLLTLNIATIVPILPKLILSGAGMSSSIPNVLTIQTEREEHRQELIRTISLLRDYRSSGDEKDLHRKLALELEGIPDTGITHLEALDLESTLDENAFKANFHTLWTKIKTQTSDIFKGRLPVDKQRIKAQVSSMLSFGRRLFVQAFFSVWQPQIYKSAAKGFKYALKRHFNDRADIEYLAKVETIAEKMDKALQTGTMTASIGDREIDIALLNLFKNHSDTLDRIQCAARAKAQQTITAATGFELQAGFMAASLGLAIYHGINGEYLSALMQYCSANLAATPLRFVGEQMEELLNAIKSNMAKTALKESEIIAKEANLPAPGYERYAQDPEPEIP